MPEEIQRSVLPADLPDGALTKEKDGLSGPCRSRSACEPRQGPLPRPRFCLSRSPEGTPGPRRGRRSLQPSAPQTKSDSVTSRYRYRLKACRQPQQRHVLLDPFWQAEDFHRRLAEAALEKRELKEHAKTKASDRTRLRQAALHDPGTAARPRAESMAHPRHGNQGISSRVAVEDGSIYTGVQSRLTLDSFAVAPTSPTCLSAKGFNSCHGDGPEDEASQLPRHGTQTQVPRTLSHMLLWVRRVPGLTRQRPLRLLSPTGGDGCSCHLHLVVAPAR